MRKARVLTNLCYSIVIVALFISSYMFTVLPIFWESPDATIIAEDLMDNYLETGGILQAGEILVVDNTDGTFSVYIDGLFAWHIDNASEMLRWTQISAEEYD